MRRRWKPAAEPYCASCDSASRRTAWRFFSHYGEAGQASSRGLYDRIVLRCYVSGRSTADGRFWAWMPLYGELATDEGFVVGRWRMDNE